MDFTCNNCQQDNQQIQQIKFRMLRSEITWNANFYTPRRHFLPRSTQTALPQISCSPHQEQSSSNTASMIQNQNSRIRDTSPRCSTKYPQSLTFNAYQSALLEQIVKKSERQDRSNSKIKNKTMELFREDKSGQLEKKELQKQVLRLKRELEDSLKQAKEAQQRLKAYENEREQLVHNRNKYVMALLEDYNNMKIIIQKLIKDNLLLRTQNQKMLKSPKYQYSKLTTPTPNQSDTLKSQIQLLKIKNLELQNQKIVAQSLQQILKNKEEDIRNLKSNEENMADKLKQLLDGLKFYHERFSEEKNELLDDHDNFKKSAMSEIARLKRELLLYSQPQIEFDFSKDANYIQLITC